VATLVKDHAIAADRLEAHGVGPLCPEKTNATDEGRARNRRVEMVGR
jgi:OOP family OmpA-OmpF porin